MSENRRCPQTPNIYKWGGGGFRHPSFLRQCYLIIELQVVYIIPRHNSPTSWTISALTVPIFTVCSFLGLDDGSNRLKVGQERELLYADVGEVK